MRITPVIAATLLLSGCLGQGPAGFTAENLVGRTFGNEAKTVLETGTANGPVLADDVVVSFTQLGQVVIAFNGAAQALTYQSAVGGYFNAAGTVALFVGTRINGAPPTPDILYLSLSNSSSSFANQLSFLVVGNNTPPAQLPTSGKATYTGKIFMTDGAQNSDVGDLSLQMNFPASELTGSFAGGFPTNTAAVFQLVPTTVSGGAFTTKLTSSDVVLTNSEFRGNFYGTFGDQIGGTVVVQTVLGNGVGQFGAAN